MHPGMHCTALCSRRAAAGDPHRRRDGGSDRCARRRWRVPSRSDVVRAGILRLVDERRRGAIGDEIIAGYERVPETAEELASAEANARAMIADEPW